MTISYWKAFLICVWVVIYNNVIIGLIIRYNRNAYRENGGLETALSLYSSQGFSQSSQCDCKELAALRIENKNYSRQITSLRIEYEELSRSYKSSRLEVEEYRAKSEEYLRSLRTCEESLREFQIKNTHEENQKLRGEIEIIKSSWNHDKNKIENLGRELTEYKMRVSSFEGNLKKCEAERDRYKDEATSFSIEIRDIRTQLNDAIRDKTNAERQINILKEEIISISTDTTKCSGIAKERDEALDEVRNLRVNITLLRDNLNDAIRARDESEGRIRTLDRDIEREKGISMSMKIEIEELKDNLNVIRRGKEDAEQQVGTLIEDNKSLKIQIQNCNEDLGIKNKGKEEINRLTIEITRLNEDINRQENKCRGDLSTLESKIVTLERKLETYDNTNFQLVTCTNDLNRAVENIQLYERTVNDLNIKIRNLEDDKRGLQEQYSQCSSVQVGSLNSEIQKLTLRVEESKIQLNNCQNELKVIEDFVSISSSKSYIGLTVQDKFRRIIDDFQECYNNNQNILIKIENCNTMINAANNRVKDYETRIRTYEINLSDWKQKHQDIQDRYSNCEVKMQSAEENLQKCRQQLQSETERYESLTIEVTTTKQIMEDCQQNLRRIEAELEQYKRTEQRLKDQQGSLNIELSQCKVKLGEETESYRIIIRQIEEDARRNMTICMNAINDYNKLQEKYNSLLEMKNKFDIEVAKLRKDIAHYEFMVNEAKQRYEDLQREMIRLRESEQRRIEELMANLTSALTISRSKDIKVKENWLIIDELLQLNQIIITALTQLNKGALATIMKGENVILRDAYDLSQEPVQKFSDIVTRFLESYTIKPLTTKSWNIFIGYLDDLESSKEFKIDIIHRTLNKRYGCSYDR